MIRFYYVLVTLIIGVAGVALSTGCTSPAPPTPAAPVSLGPPTRLPLTLSSTPLREKLSFVVSIGFVRLAMASLWWHRTSAGVGILSSRAWTSGAGRFFRDTRLRATTVVSLEHGDVRTSRRETDDQGQLRVVSTYFAAEHVSIRFERGQGSGMVRRDSIAELAPMDPESFLWEIRQWRPSRGQQLLAVVVSGRTLWLVKLTAETPRMLNSRLGSLRAQELAGRARRLDADGVLLLGAKPRHLRFFLSDDEQRLPLRIEADGGIGSVTIELLNHFRLRVP